MGTTHLEKTNECSSTKHSTMASAFFQASGFGLMLFGILYAGYRAFRRPGDKFFM